MPELSVTWQNRIVGQAVVDPSELLMNPRNWRTHPEEQQQALASVLDTVGWVQNVIVNKRSGYVVDGHMRVEAALLNKATGVPVVYVDLNEQEELAVLASLDPISAMAETDGDALSALLHSVHLSGMEALLSQIAADKGVVPPDFEPVTFDDVAPIDELLTKTCPACGHEF